MMEEFWKKNETGEKIFYVAGKEIGNRLKMVKYIMSKKGLSSSKSHKYVDKIREINEKI